MKSKILVVDDEPQIRKALKLNLEVRGYDVLEACTGETALSLSASEHPDVVLLDLGLPGIDGASVVEALRGWSDVPVIVLTARTDEPSKVRLLDLGVDHYVTKPFGMPELAARIRAVLRRANEGANPSAEIVTDDFRLDLANLRAFVGPDEVEVHLTPTEWAIVTFLVRNSNRLITYRQLQTAVWGPMADADPNLLRVHMTHIRRKLEPSPTSPRHFVTDAGAGYRFDVDDRAPREEIR